VSEASFDHEIGDAETVKAAFAETAGSEIQEAGAIFSGSTKFTGGDSPNAGVSFTDNSRKNMIRSVEASLKRLGTDRIDLYRVHFPDFVTPIDEIVRGLDDLVTAGKILLRGIFGLSGLACLACGHAGGASRLGAGRCSPA
jgi:predicted oxidoreductase